MKKIISFIFNLSGEANIVIYLVKYFKFLVEVRINVLNYLIISRGRSERHWKWLKGIFAPKPLTSFCVHIPQVIICHLPCMHPQCIGLPFFFSNLQDSTISYDIAYEVDITNSFSKNKEKDITNSNLPFSPLMPKVTYK